VTTSETIHAKLKPLIGKKISRVIKGWPNSVSIKFGEVTKTHKTSIERFGKSTRTNYFAYEADENLLIEHSWRMEKAGETIAKFDDDDVERTNVAIKFLEGQALEGFDLVEPSHEAVFSFSGGVKIFILDKNTEDDNMWDAWSLWLPNKEYVSIGPGGKISFGTGEQRPQSKGQ
jgi:hypothetical protein